MTYAAYIISFFHVPGPFSNHRTGFDFDFHSEKNSVIRVQRKGLFDRQTPLYFIKFDGHSQH